MAAAVLLLSEMTANTGASELLDSVINPLMLVQQFSHNKQGEKVLRLWTILPLSLWERVG
jgi:hypothetical protein